MKRWAVITLGLYVGLLLVLTVPVGALCFWDWDVVRFFEVCWYWLVIAIFVLSAALLMVVPVKGAEGIQIRKRRIFTPIVAVSVAVAILIAGVVASVMAAIFGDKFWIHLDNVRFWIAIAIIAALWVLWFFLFRRYAKLEGSPEQITDRITAFLFKGSILELLVAVSCHIIVRKRGDCSAPIMTFFGIATGIAVMLMTFGPGVYWLFLKRAKKITPKVEGV